MGGVRTKTSMIMTTRKAYFKDGVEVSRPRSLVYSGSTYVPPKDDILIAAGYEIRDVEIPEPTPYVPTYEERVVELIRLRYDINEELAILRQRDSKPEEFAEYNAYCEECKTIARVECGLQEVKEVPVAEEPIEDIVEPIE